MLAHAPSIATLLGAGRGRIMTPRPVRPRKDARAWVLAVTTLAVPSARGVGVRRAGA